MVYNRANDEVAAKTEPIALGFTTDEQITVKVDHGDVEAKIRNVGDFSGETNRELIKYILESKNYNEEDAIDDLLDETKKD
jgi:hypothetical protein